ncbi:MAG: serine/threonine-protein phosphatase, partial [Sphaerospermopsis sp. SIO1G2]|nr:serine/threonine-protein phosphatase [Sphaerospermopsis sp. SIO1G2]
MNTTTTVKQTSDHLVIQINTTITLENYHLEIFEYLGQLTIDVYYFHVKISTLENPEPQLGLLRIGAIDSGLSREIQLREKLKDYKLIAPLILQTQLDTVTININSSEGEDLPKIEKTEVAEIETNDTENELETESEFLEEEYYQQQEMTSNLSRDKIILLSYIPEVNNTLKTWLTAENSLEKSILLASQVCQFFRYLHQQKWCMVSI